MLGIDASDIYTITIMRNTVDDSISQRTSITSKLVNEAYMAAFADKWYVLFFYCLNFVMVFTDLLIYFRNLRLDKQAKQ